MTKLKSLATTLTGLTLYAVACTATAGAWHTMGGSVTATATASNPVTLSVKIIEKPPFEEVLYNDELFGVQVCTDTAMNGNDVGVTAPGNVGRTVEMMGPDNNKIHGKWQAYSDWSVESNVYHPTMSANMAAGDCSRVLNVILDGDQPGIIPGVYSATIQGVVKAG